jgi:hypothetical protein
VQIVIEGEEIVAVVAALVFGFGVESAGFRLQDLRLRVQGVGFLV